MPNYTPEPEYNDEVRAHFFNLTGLELPDKRPHTPNSLRQQCGCEVSINITYISETVELDYCPLHAAARAMLEALEETVRALEGYPDESDSIEAKRARAAIAAAKGESK